MFYNHILSFILIIGFLANCQIICFAENEDIALQADKEEAIEKPVKKYKLSQDYLYRVKKEVPKIHSGIDEIDLSYPETSKRLGGSISTKEDDIITKREIKETKMKAGFYVATATAELMDSIYLPYFSKGLFNIIGTAYKLRSYRKTIEKKYGIYLELSEDEAFFIYEGKF